MARVMICDDSVFMRMMLKNLLVENGHEIVAEAGDGMEAVKLYHEHKPELITMDITMPRMDGIEAVKVIHDDDPLIRIIMVSAIGQQAIVTDAIKAGASDFIVKPFDPPQVLATIRRILKK